MGIRVTPGAAARGLLALCPLLSLVWLLPLISSKARLLAWVERWELSYILAVGAVVLFWVYSLRGYYWLLRKLEDWLLGEKDFEGD